MNIHVEDPALLLERLEVWITGVRGRGLVTEESAERLREMLTQSRGERLDTPDDPLLVLMLCGPTLAGKSSLINAIAGAEISSPGLGAHTSAARVYVHERDDPARLFEYSEALGHLGRKAASVVRHNRDELLHKVLIDTPDIDSVVRDHRQLTEALVNCADLVLFVTSPEKYKDLHSAAWVRQLRQQRAVAFVLSKWDRVALGPQHAQRHLLEQDFHSLLAFEGFQNPLIFKVSTLATSTASDFQNELAALRDWIEEGLGRSAATAIQERRRRAAWGRLSAVLAAAVPEPISSHSLVTEIVDRLSSTRVHARRLGKSEAFSLSKTSLDHSVRPNTPGLLGGSMELMGRIGAAVSPFRGLLAWRSAISRSVTSVGSKSMVVSEFGQSAALVLANTTAEITQSAKKAGLPLGPVGGSWAAEASHLRQQLAMLPTEVEADILAGELRPSLRRSAGLAVLFIVEALLAAVLLIALWRVGSGFLLGSYAPGRLILNTVALVVGLLILGHFAANLFFPALQERLCRIVGQRTEGIIDSAWRTSTAAFQEQLEAATQLMEEGKKLLGGIDRLTMSLASVTAAQTNEVKRLFGDAIEGDRKLVSASAPETNLEGQAGRRRPKFD